MANIIDFNALENNVYDYTPKRGTYFKYNGRSYFVHFPSNVNENTTIFVAGHGNGSNGITHASRMFDATKDKNVIVIEPVAVDNMNDFTNIPGLAQDIAAHYNINTPNIIMSGHSATGVNALKGGEAVIKATGSPTLVVLSDGHNTHTRVNIDSSVYKDSVVIGLKPVEGANLLQQKNGFSTMDRLKSIAKAGGKVIVCTYSNTTPVHSGPTELDHNASNGVAVALGTYDMNSIKLVDSGKVQHRGNTIDAVYKYQYLDENGVLHNFNSAEEAQAYLDAALEKCGASLKTETVNTSNVQYYDANAYRDTTYQLDTSTGNNSTLASDLGVVMDAMNNLSGVVKSNSFTKASNGAASTVPLVGLLYDGQNYLFGVSSTLSDNIGKESAVIANIAQAIYNMDSQLAINASGLNGQTGINETLSKILSTDITIPYASFSSPVSFEKTTQGHAGKLCLSDLKALLSGGSLSGSLANGFDTDNSDTRKTIDSIKAFQEKIASNALQGDIWKEVNAKLDNYKNLLDKRLQSNDKLKTAYEEAIKLLEEYMGDYEELDDSKIEELKTKVTQLESEIESLQAQINQMQDVCTPSTEDKPKSCHKEYVYSASARAGFQQQINQNRELIEELNREIAKLEGLWEVINQAGDIVNGAIDEIKADYSKDVQDVAVASPEQVLASTDQATNVPAPADVDTNTGTASTESTNPGTTTTERTPNRSSGSRYTGGGYSSGGTNTTTPTTNRVVSTTNTQKPNDIIEVSPAVESTQQTEPTVVSNTNSGGGARPYTKSSIAESEPAIIPVETDNNVIAEEIVEPPVQEEPMLSARTPTLDDIIHEPQNEKVVMVDQPNLVEQPPTSEKASSLLKAGGVLLGVGLTAGAVASAVHESQKSDQESEDAYESEQDYKYVLKDEDYY